MNQENRKLALIIGGSSGIGAGAALELSHCYDVAIVYRSSDKQAKEIEAKIREHSQDVKFKAYKLKISCYEEIISLNNKIKDDFSIAPEILVVSIGDVKSNLFLNNSNEDIGNILNEHLTIPISICHNFLPNMYRKKFGRVILVGSIAYKFHRRGQSLYSSAKAGLDAFCRNLALETAHRGVTINIIHPGLISTKSVAGHIENLRARKITPERYIPVGRVGEPKDISKMILFLALEESTYITGASIVIDGGKSLGDNFL